METKYFLQSLGEGEKNQYTSQTTISVYNIRWPNGSYIFSNIRCVSETERPSPTITVMRWEMSLTVVSLSFWEQYPVEPVYWPSKVQMFAALKHNKRNLSVDLT